jgi:hypothetical protein
LVSALPKLEEECFFIAPIGPDNSEERNRSDGVLEFIVARAAEELSLRVVRADQLDAPGQITAQVIQHVLGSKAAVADLTGRNPNVYYELAIRHTAKLPTVLIADEGEVLPFDIAQMRTIFFSHTDLRSADHCRTEIVRHLRQALDGARGLPDCDQRRSAKPPSWQHRRTQCRGIGHERLATPENPSQSQNGYPPRTT